MNFFIKINDGDQQKRSAFHTKTIFCEFTNSIVTVRANKFSLICVTAYYMQGNDLVHAKRRTLQPYLEILTFHFWGAKSLFSISKWA